MTGVARLGGLIRSVDRRCSDPIDRLEQAVLMAGDLRATGDSLIDHYVEQARAREVSWNEIGEVLGMSKQGAQQRFRGRWFDRFIRPTKGRRARYLTDRARRSIEHAREEARA